MSDCPVIIIKKNDLEKNRRLIMMGNSSKKNSKVTMEVIVELVKALNKETIKFPELEFVIIQPELTSHSKRVLKLLDSYNIEYRTMIW